MSLSGGWYQRVAVIGLLAMPLSGAAASLEDAEIQRLHDGGGDSGLLEGTREGLRGATGWLARGVDGWFGDKPFEEGGKVAGALRIKGLWRQNGSNSAGVRLRARVSLPNLKERAYLFFGQENERDLVTDQPVTFTREQQLQGDLGRRDSTGFAGLGYTIRDQLDLRAGVRGGYRLYAQARYRKHWQLGEQGGLEFRETLFWTVKDGVGSNTGLGYEYRLSPAHALRWQSAAVVTQKGDGVAWSSSIGSFRRFGDHRHLALEALVNGNTSSRARVDEYGVRAVWRQSLHRDWVIGELVVGHFWPHDHRADERERTWAIGTGVELLF